MKKIVLAVALISISNTCYAWTAEGHDCSTRLAITAISKQMPEFFSQGGNTIAHCSGDPDIFKIPVDQKQLRSTESPEHYIDLELLDGRELPPTREEFVELCAKQHLSPAKVGMVPYAISEWIQRLTLAFAEYRKWPNNEIIRAKCLIYAGSMAHYAEDLCMPLHTTIHYDGMIQNGGRSAKTGIHLKVDSLIEKVSDCNGVVKSDAQLQKFDNAWSAIIARLTESHSLVPKVYELEAQIPDTSAPIKPGTQIAGFAHQELLDSAQFTARLFLTAWESSEQVKIPDWDKRKASETIGK